MTYYELEARYGTHDREASSSKPPKRNHTMSYYDLIDIYGVAGAERICTLAEQFTNQVRVKMSTAVAWAIAQYEQSTELAQERD